MTYKLREQIFVGRASCLTKSDPSKRDRSSGDELQNKAEKLSLPVSNPNETISLAMTEFNWVLVWCDLNLSRFLD